MNKGLYERVLDRILNDDKMAGRSGDLVLAACDGEQELDALLESSEPGERPEPGDGDPKRHVPGTYVKSVSVTGFRGTGGQAALEPTPGPGLTLVVGRNGSGKSSCAEDLEYLLTGTCWRWDGKGAAVWKEGWQPFRFIVIDDPVQSMDPAKIDGLASVLDSASRTHQVVVFTHDDRLFEAVRRMGIQATVVEVTRRQNSAVEISPLDYPAKRLLTDAHALAKEPNLQPEVVSRVVPGFCRMAVEATVNEVVRRRRLARGEKHREVETLLSEARTLREKAALVLYDDVGRAGEVKVRMQKLGFGRTFDELNKGAHGSFAGDALEFVRDVNRLAGELAKL